MEKTLIIKYTREFLNANGFYYKEAEDMFYMYLAKPGRKCASIIVPYTGGISGFFSFPWQVREHHSRFFSSLNSINTGLKFGCLYLDERNNRRTVVFRHTVTITDIFVFEDSIQELIETGFSVFLNLWDEIFGMIHKE